MAYKGLKMQVGDLVKVKTKHYGTMVAVVVGEHFSNLGRDFIVQPSNHPRQVVCSPCDLEVINASR